MTHFSAHAPTSPTHLLSLSAVCPITSLPFYPIFIIFIKIVTFQPRERGRMRFHAIQNVETALRFLRLVHWLWQKFQNFWQRSDPQVQGDQAGQHQGGGHCGRQPQAHPRPHLDNHPPLPGRRERPAFHFYKQSSLLSLSFQAHRDWVLNFSLRWDEKLVRILLVQRKYNGWCKTGEHSSKTWCAGRHRLFLCVAPNTNTNVCTIILCFSV